jgi:hypothetical protein
MEQRGVMSAGEVEVWTRSEAITQIRRALLKHADGERSMCAIAAELGIFCRGFRRWHDRGFHLAWRSVIGVSTHLTRAQMERLADLWQLSEQLRLRVPIACDSQTICAGACRGWNEFSNEKLEQFCSDILGKRVVLDEAAGRNEDAPVELDGGTHARAGHHDDESRDDRSARDR